MSYWKNDWSWATLGFSNKNYTIIFLVFVLGFFAVWLAPVQLSDYDVKHFASWHTIVECVSVAISVSIFSVTWEAKVVDETHYRLNIVSIAFFSVAILDLAHLLTFGGMPDWIIPPGHGDAIPFWLFARYAASFALIVMVAPLREGLRFSFPLKWVLLAAGIYVAIPFLLFVAIPNAGSLFIVPGKGLTGLKIGLEWGVIGLLVIALVINNYNSKNARFYNINSVMLAIYLSILSELCFTLYSNIEGVFDVLGHVFKIASYIFLYKGISIAGLKLPFEELAKNEELLEQIATHIKKIVMLSTVDRQEIFYVNNSFEKITGKTVSSLINDPRNWYEAIYPDDRESVRRLLSENIGKEFTHEFRMINADGEVRYMEETINPIIENDGSIKRATSVCQDITNQKTLQNIISERERLLNNMINGIPLVIGFWGKDMRSKFANKAYSHWFGKSKEEVLNIHVKDLLGEELYKKNEKHINAALRGEAQEFERSLRVKNGELRHAIIHYEPDIRNGVVDGFYTAITDVTAIKNTQEELRLSEDRLLRSQALGHIGSWEIDLKSGNAWWSEENYRIYGVKNATKVDIHTSIDLVHPDDREGLLNVWEISLKTQSTYSHEHRIITPDNNIRYVWEFAEISYDDRHNPHLLAGCTQDITNRKREEFDRVSLQNQLMQSQKMESIGHLTGGIAHDFNNMLGAILGYAELLKQVLHLDGEAGQRPNKYISEILTAGNRAKELIAQMLVFSRYNPGTHSDAPVIQVQPVIKEVVNLLRSSIPATISINYHMTGQSLRAMIHPIQLHQILLNLAINARDAITGYGKIDIAISRGFYKGNCNSCHHEYSGKYLEIIVSDDGEGIGKEGINKIFDPFYTTKEVGKGTGMGLSVVHGIVHSLGGHITLSSKIDNGSAFHIFLPTTENASIPEVADSMLEEDNNDDKLLNGIRIMVVDDEVAITSLLTDLLELYGAQVASFNRSSDALTAFMRYPDYYDLVITDQTMPDLSGMDMSKIMLRKRPGLPIILCTGYSDTVTREITKGNGLAGFMIKPVKSNDLIGEIKRIKNI